MRVLILAPVLSVLCILDASPARACASCNCGDSTLTATGVEKPYRNRMRLALEERLDDHQRGAGPAALRMLTLRSQLAASWSPHDRVTWVAALPWLTQFNTPNGAATQTLNGLGDLESSLRVVAYRDRKFAPEHLLWLGAGLKMPTGPRIMGDNGYPVSDDDQPGSGSWDPFFGATYGWFGGLTSVFLSASYRVTTPGPRGYRRGQTVGAAAWVQIQPWWWGAATVGLDGAWTDAATLPNGMPSPDTGGTVGRITAALLASPRQDLLIRLAVAVPAVQIMNGAQSEGLQGILSLAYDVR
jgi:hypothetical protein